MVPLRVGVVGLGKMGAGIARNLHRKDHLRCAWDADPHARESAGVPVARSLDDLAREVEAVVLSVPVVPQDRVEEVLLALAQHLRPGSIVVDTGNSDPLRSADRARRLRERSVAFLDVGVSGGPERAAAGTLELWVGGDRGAYERVRPALEAVGRPAHVETVLAEPHPADTSGYGHAVKMLHNCIEQGFMQVLADAVNAAPGLGLDWRKSLDLVRRGLVRSHLGDLLVERVSEADLAAREARVEGGDYPRMFRDYLRARGVEEPAPSFLLSLWVRELSRSGDRPAAVARAAAEMAQELRRFEDPRKFRRGFQTLGALRRAFGGHQ